MGGLCGWFGNSFNAEISTQTIEEMLSECGCPAGSSTSKISGVSHGLAVIQDIYCVSIAEQDGVRAALLGSPKWEDRELAEMASTLGLANSLIKAYRDYGRGFLQRLHGAFALAVLTEREALIAIDRIGIHTLSYALQKGVFVFSSSTGSVASHPVINKAIDPQAIFNYFYFHDIPSPGTIYQDVQKLLPAQYIQFQDGQIEKSFYWRAHYNDHDHRSFSSEKEQLHQLLSAAVTAAGDNSRSATFLSGGTDSSTVTGMLAKNTSHKVDTYSIGFSAEEFDEMKYARLAAKHFGTSPHEYYLKPDDIVEAIPVITLAYDEPFGNDSAVPTYFCAKLAADNGVKVMLAGDGGDEIFGGNARYAKQMVFEHYTSLPAAFRKSLIEPFVFNFPAGEQILPIRKMRSYIRQANYPLPERMESYNFILRQPMHEIFEADFVASVDTSLPDTMLRDAYFRTDASHPINRMLHLDLKFTLADNDLRKVSRMCEVAGIEVRYPMLDESIVEFAAQLPHNFKVKGQKLRWFFKEALRDFLPEEIINKSKHGFGLPFGYWSISHPPLKALVDETLSRFETRGYMRPDYIRNLRRLHAEEHPTYFGKMIWVMVMLEQWLESHK